MKISEKQKDDHDFVCGHCQKARHSKHPFKSYGIRTSAPFEIIYSDICGPFPTSHDGSKYFVTFTDDFTRFTRTFRLKSRDEIYEVYKKFRSMVKAHFNCVIKTFVSDNAGEYASAKLQDQFDEDGTIWAPTVAYNPQENGVSERLNRTLLSKLRAMLVESNLPKEIWTELLDTATYLKNRTPTQLLEETPYEKLHGMKPDLSHLRTIGTLAWAMIPSEKQLEKLEERSKECKPLGYDGNSQYILYEIESGKVIWSRDVVFEEKSASGGDEALKDHVQLPDKKEIDTFRTKLDLGNIKTVYEPPSKPSQEDPPKQPTKSSKLETTFSKYGRQRFPSLRLKEAEAVKSLLTFPQDTPQNEHALKTSLTPRHLTWEEFGCLLIVQNG
jgi:hypothetical protein